MRIDFYTTKLQLFVVSFFLIIGTGCGGSDDSEPEIDVTPTPTVEATATPEPTTEATPTPEATATPTPEPTTGTTLAKGLDFANFLSGSIVGDVAEVECTLTNGTVTTCYQFTTT